MVVNMLIIASGRLNIWQKENTNKISLCLKSHTKNNLSLIKSVIFFSKIVCMRSS